MLYTAHALSGDGGIRLTLQGTYSTFETLMRASSSSAFGRVVQGTSSDDRDPKNVYIRAAEIRNWVADLMRAGSAAYAEILNA